MCWRRMVAAVQPVANNQYDYLGFEVETIARIAALSSGRRVGHATTIFASSGHRFPEFGEAIEEDGDCSLLHVASSLVASKF